MSDKYDLVRGWLVKAASDALLLAEQVVGLAMDALPPEQRPARSAQSGDDQP